ncbi:MAG: hypothetical protein JWQ78_1703, partial [Sediminibacterium sp.]|nr:hypothetical protein [Sediminibacterium sp.]
SNDEDLIFIHVGMFLQVLDALQKSFPG